MDSHLAAISGSFEACYRFYIDVSDDIDNLEMVIINATGMDVALELVKKEGFDTDLIFDYTVC